LVRDMMNLIVYANGNRDLMSIAEIIGADYFQCAEIADKLVLHSVLEVVPE